MTRFGITRGFSAPVLALVATLAITGCSDDADVADEPGPRLVTTVGNYNVVKFNRNVYGVPHGVAIDWKKDDLAKVPGIIIDISVEKVELAVKGLPGKDSSAASPVAPQASLVTTIGRYNIVKYNDNVYGLPQGVAVDWQKDDLSKVDGIVSGSSVTLVKISVIGRVIGDKVSRLTGGK